MNCVRYLRFYVVTNFLRESKQNSQSDVTLISLKHIGKRHQYISISILAIYIRIIFGWAIMPVLLFMKCQARFIFFKCKQIKPINL